MQKLSYIVLLLFLAAGLACAQAPEEAAAPAEEEGADLAGVYEFVRMDTPEGENTDQFGRMIVSEDQVCHLRVAKEREEITAEDPEDVQMQKAAALFGATTAACGEYSFEEETLTVNWVVSSNPSVEGNSTEFQLTENEDGTISLAPAASPEFKFVYRKTQ